MKSKLFVHADEVAADFGISRTKAYEMIKKLNKELEERGFLTIAGRVSRKYYLERVYGSCDENREVDSDEGQ